MAFNLSRINNFKVQKVYKYIITINDINLPYEYVESVTFPTTDSSGESFHLGGGSINLPSFYNTSSVTIEFTEDNQGSMLKTLMAWKRLVISDDGVFGYPDSSSGSEGFAKNGLLLLLDDSHESHTSIKFEGMWPTAMAPITMTYAESNKVTVTQEFAVDQIIVE